MRRRRHLWHGICGRRISSFGQRRCSEPSARHFYKDLALLIGTGGFGPSHALIGEFPDILLMTSCAPRLHNLLDRRSAWWAAMGDAE
jgi:hypothetical protein